MGDVRVTENPHLRQLESEAYTAVMKAMACSDMDWEKEKFLTNLRQELHISAEQHFQVLELVMSDPELAAIRESRKAGYVHDLDAGHAKGGPLHKKPRLSDRGGGASPAVMPPPAPVAQAPAPTTHRGPGRPPISRNGVPATSAQEMPPPQTGHRGGGRTSRPSAAGQPTVSGSGQRKVKRERGLARANSSISSASVDLTAAAALADTQAGQINELIGRKIWRYWPEEEEQWALGVVTDYNLVTEEHAITYRMNEVDEQYEWVRLRDLSPGSQYKLTTDMVDLSELGPSQKRGQATKRDNTFSGRGRGGRKSRGGGRGGRPSGLHRPVKQIKKVPFDLGYFQRKLTSGSVEELEGMKAQLDSRFQEISGEMATLDAIERTTDDPIRLLELQRDDLDAQERAIRLELADLPSSDDEL
ncbi:hypothetical protein WJX72_009073 [[Myrmecia] bisecta]|uniref:ENT domain-containing protein n=1 Tax=[Myrmecia] bisecta TaxID=41462 RepID=A0AAW1R8W8_9CHLO